MCSNTDSLQQWLRSRGSHVSKVRLHGSEGVITTLPCPRLEWLVLEDIEVDLPRQPAAAGPVCAGAPALGSH